MAAHHLSQGDGPPNVSASPPTSLSGAEQEQAAALMTLGKYLTPDAMIELRRQLREHNNAQSMIFRFPAELRNRMFEMAFLHDLATSEAGRGTIDEDGHLEGDIFSLETYKEFRPLIYGPDSMNTCRQMRSECQSLLQLDKVKITEYMPKDRIPHVFSPSGRGLLGPMVTAHCEFYGSPHPSDQAALKWARTWWISLHNRSDIITSGMVWFPSTLGIKPRSFVLLKEASCLWEDAESWDEYDMSHQLKPGTASEQREWKKWKNDSA